MRCRFSWKYLTKTLSHIEVSFCVRARFTNFGPPCRRIQGSQNTYIHAYFLLLYILTITVGLPAPQSCMGGRSGSGFVYSPKLEIWTDSSLYLSGGNFSFTLSAQAHHRSIFFIFACWTMLGYLNFYSGLFEPDHTDDQ